MKKVLGLVLLLALASTSFGAVAQFTTPILEVHPSDIIRISIVADFDAKALGIRQINDGVPGTTALPTGEAGVGGVNSLFTLAPQAGAQYLVNMDHVLFRNTAGNAIGGSLISGSVPAGQELAWFTYHVPQVPFSTLILIEPVAVGTTAAGIPGVTNTANVKTTLTGVTLHVVPEPMTLSLLALGGLALLRRRH